MSNPQTTKHPDFIEHKLIVEADEGVLDAQTYVFNFSDEPIPALVVGDIKQIDQPLTRLQSRCIYGEVFLSKECDCKAQLDKARQKIIDEGAGIIIYLNQEGRGSGLINKARAYRECHEDDLNTVEAYRRLGLNIDERSYDHAAELLQTLGIQSVKLLTNNPAKVEGLTEEGLNVERIPLRTEPTPYNIDYLKVKQNKLGHYLAIEENIDETRDEGE